MEIVDTAGQEEFSSFRDSSVATGEAFLVLFAINSASSWHELKDLRSKIIQDRQLTSAIPMIIVGNKLVRYFFMLSEVISRKQRGQVVSTLDLKSGDLSLVQVSL